MITPLPSVIVSKVDYKYIPYRVRQKMAAIQSYVIEAQRYSHCDYRLYMMEDGCMLIDYLYNKILWKSSYNVPSLVTRLKELVNYWNYENQKNSIQVQKNKQRKLQQTYGN